MLYQIVLADFRERTRRYSFLITLGFVLFFGFLVNTGKYAVNFGQYRGVYNSAWVGSLMALGTSTMICFAGFYLIKNCLKRDHGTRVGEILATTQMSNSFYLFAKFISNVFTLSIMVLFLVAAAVVMQIFGSSKEEIDFWALISPFLFTTLPAVVLVSALALLFETIPFLRGGIGNVTYFIMAEVSIFAGAFAGVPILDVIGAGTYLPSMKAAAMAAFPGVKMGLQMGFVGFVEETAPNTKLFIWNGVEWNLTMILPKLILMGFALGIVFLCTHLFRRGESTVINKLSRLSKTITTEESLINNSQLKIKDITPATVRFRFLSMLRVELWLMLKGSHLAWYLMALITIVLQLVLPYQYARTIALPLAWIWPLLKWSAMGIREKRFNTIQLLQSSPSPLKRQLPATWCAGLIVTLVMGNGMILRSIIVGDFSLLYALFIAALFIPTFALFLGITSGSQKLFEVIYLVIWYLGPINRLEMFDFIAVTDQTLTTLVPISYLIISLALIPLTMFIRSKEGKT
jgi:hypothetical protein